MRATLTTVVSALLRFLGLPLRQGRWTRGSAYSARGLLAIAPLVAPRREYLVYEPRGYTRWRRSPLIVLCHGCRQTPEDFAQGTRIAAAADAGRWVVLMPRQRDNANAWSCWNWFDRATAEGRGEAAIVAAMTRTAIRRRHVDAARVIAVGLSAGGALAAVLGVRYPKIFCGVAVHSGIPCGAAPTPLAATSVMARGPQAEVAAIGAAARDSAHRVALLAIHGTADDVVAPRNATALVRQYLAMAGVPLETDALPAADAERNLRSGERPVRTRDWRVGGVLAARLVEVHGLRHAWSGGDDALPYNDPLLPDATAMIRDWLREIAPHSAKMGHPTGDRQ